MPCKTKQESNKSYEALSEKIRGRVVVVTNTNGDDVLDVNGGLKMALRPASDCVPDDLGPCIAHPGYNSTSFQFNDPSPGQVKMTIQLSPPGGWAGYDFGSLEYSVNGGARIAATVPAPGGSVQIGPWADTATNVTTFTTNSLRPDCGEDAFQVW